MVDLSTVVRLHSLSTTYSGQIYTSAVCSTVSCEFEKKNVNGVIQKLTMFTNR